MNTSESKFTSCVGCGVELAPVDGPTHAYMVSSPACFEIFTRILAAEYSSAELWPTHRHSVDAYAIQHSSGGQSRRQIQSVGLHLARLSIQMSRSLSPGESNDVMLGLGAHKSTLISLQPPAKFSMTVGDVEPYIGGSQHAEKVREWAVETWHDWSIHHEYITDWIERCRRSEYDRR